MKVLLVEDNPGDARLLQEFLGEVSSVEFDLKQAQQLIEALRFLEEESFEVILLDLLLPDSQGLDTFIKIHRQFPAIPIIVLTGFDDETIAIKAMQEGAQDYLVKGQVNGDLLFRCMRYAIERQRTEEALRQSEERFRQQAALLDVTTDAIFVRDLDNRILYWNKGAENLYGWLAEEACGENASKFLYQETPLEEERAFTAVVKKGKWQGEVTKMTKHDKEILVESRWTLVCDENGQPKSILTVDTDISEKKLLESQLFRAQRLESIGTLASGIAHDLNNILTPILAVSQLLPLKYPNIYEQDMHLLEILEDSAKRGADLVKQVLSFARGVEGKRITLQLRHLIKEVLTILKETFPKSIEVRTDLPQDLWMVSGDSTQLHQVLMNLCVNARDAMPNGGTLTILGENLYVDENYARMHLEAKTGYYTVITVADTGLGIPREILDRIFEPFFTTKEHGKGTGLGLSTVIGIVKSHGGFVNVYSEVGSGTCFKVYFPSVQEMETELTQEIGVLMGNGELILVVDDEPSIQEITKASLEAYNYKILTASDGIEAIALYAQHKDTISAVLIDMMLPTLDGLTAIRAIQKINPQVKIIPSSGLMSSSKLAEAVGETAKIFLSKPYTVKELLHALQTVLH